MGFLSRLFSFGSNESGDSTTDQKTTALKYLQQMQNQWGCFQVEGTTTFMCEQAMKDGVALAGDAPGYAEVRGWLMKDPLDPDYPERCWIYVSEEAPIGALFGAMSKNLSMLPPGERLPIQVQIFTSQSPKGLRVDAWFWVGSQKPTWRYSRTSRPPVTTQERASEHQALASQIVKRGLASGGKRAREIRAGMIDGVHYLELAEPIKELKRQGRLVEALELCYKAIDATENAALIEKEHGSEYALPPAYTIHAAIIHRKLKQYEEEIAVLERYKRAVPRKYWLGSKPEVRLSKIRVKQAKKI